ncbi:Lysophospholipase [Klebsormidium nitens]|uniref:Lysophospholipase n=1 Tax=Klebsormidium nitens TaxID=105231 RepID=A0A0U9HQJ5_KLENI|nr:Lysophospholipase [Klebsormidium nitens]|eukprot:GAQ80599.1 Lysophospholipase [Klebsormidium nitens]
MASSSSGAATAVQAVFIFMHGLGDSGDSWEGITWDFKDPEFRNLKWEFPNAPIAPVSCNGGYRMPSWFDLLEIPITPASPHTSDKELLAAIHRVHAKVDKYKASGVPASSIFLGGFSQGGALALASSLLYPETLGGAVVFSGWIPSQELQITEGGKKTPILWCHGDADNVVEYANARVGCPRLQAAGVSCELKTYPRMAHSSCPQEIADLKSWLKAQLTSQVTTV